MAPQLANAMLRPQCLRRAVTTSTVLLPYQRVNARFYTSIQRYRPSTSPLQTKQILRPLFAQKVPLLSSQRRLYADHVVKVPQMAESISEGTLKQFSKSIGDYVEQDEEIASIETDKIDVAVNAPVAGTIKEFLVKEEDTVTVGQDLVRLETGGSSSESKDVTAKSEPKAAASKSQSTSSQPSGEIEQEKPEQAKPNDEQQQKTGTPAEEKSAAPPQQEEIKQQTKSASPPPKREEVPKSKDLERSKQQTKPAEQTSASSGVGNRAENRVKMNRMRLRIAERLKQSQNTAASLTTFQKVDMSALMDFRKQYKDEVLKKTGVKLGFMSAFTRASILAMRDIPAVNASIEGPGGGDTIVYRDYVDISVAVATEKGLVTPVVRNAEALDMIGIEKAIAELGKKARDNKLTIEDMAGGTYTISNGGVFGSLFGTPIINLPQTAVLGLHAINEEVVVINGKFEARPIMYLALTYDHRLLDGREAVTFLVKVKEYIQDPRRMLL